MQNEGKSATEAIGDRRKRNRRNEASWLRIACLHSGCTWSEPSRWPAQYRGNEARPRSNDDLDPAQDRENEATTGTTEKTVSIMMRRQGKVGCSKIDKTNPTARMTGSVHALKSQKTKPAAKMTARNHRGMDEGLDALAGPGQAAQDSNSVPVLCVTVRPRSADEGQREPKHAWRTTAFRDGLEGCPRSQPGGRSEPTLCRPSGTFGNAPLSANHEPMYASRLGSDRSR
jgi:hypothetical protein